MKFYILLIWFVQASFVFSQTSKTMVYDGLEREYLEYIPDVYDGTKEVPLMLCLHGLGDDMNHFFTIGMDHIADTANFIFLTPQALDDTIDGQSTGTAWNSGIEVNGVIINEDIDDVGFLMSLIDSTAKKYKIDKSRIYVMGFSMGAFMSNRLACEKSDKITAIASVSGTIGNAISCQPQFPISVCHFHGTNDQTVKYVDNDYGNDAEALVEYWSSFNHCETTATISHLPDLADDGRTVDYYYYGNGDSQTSVGFYKVNEGEHDWMYLPDYDISYSIEIWNFFRTQKKYNSNICFKEQSSNVILYPNPANRFVFVEKNNLQAKQCKIYDSQGQLIKNISLSSQKSISSSQNKMLIDISDLSIGIYFIRIGERSIQLIVE